MFGCCVDIREVTGESEVESEVGIVLSEYDHYLYIYMTPCSFVLKMVTVILLEMDATFMSTKKPLSSLLQKDGVTCRGVCTLCYNLFVYLLASVHLVCCVY